MKKPLRLAILLGFGVWAGWWLANYETTRRQVAAEEKARAAQLAIEAEALANSDDPVVIAAAAQARALAEFKKWLEDEAVEVNRPKVDVEQAQQKMQAAVQALTPERSRVLLETIRSSTASAGAKILSVYLLIEGGERTLPEMTELLLSPVPTHGASVAHSATEVRNTQERSMRVMAIEGLATRAKTDLRARAALEKIAQTAPDSALRTLAEQRLRDIAAH